MKTNLLSESTKLANPNTPTVFETRWRCIAGRGKHRQSSIHKTREEAELSASNCRGRWPYGNSVRVEQTREEFFDLSSACPQTKAATTAKTLDQTEATCDWFDNLDEQEVRWSLRDEGRNPDGSGLSYAERQV